MKQAIKTHWALNSKDLPVYLAMPLAGFLVGQIILFLVLRLLGDPSDGWFPIATLLALIIGMICAAIFAGFSFLTRYQMALSMGRTRKPQIAAEALFSLVRSAVLVLEVWLLSLLDKALHSLLYPELSIELSPATFLQLPAITACLLIPTVCSLLIAGILGRFGKKAGAVLYFAFLAVCILGPRLIGHIQPDSLADRMFSAVFGIPPLAMIAVCVLLLTLLVFAAVRMLLTMRVTFP